MSMRVVLRQTGTLTHKQQNHHANSILGTMARFEAIRAELNKLQATSCEDTHDTGRDTRNIIAESRELMGKADPLMK